VKSGKGLSEETKKGGREKPATEERGGINPPIGGKKGHPENGQLTRGRIGLLIKSTLVSNMNRPYNKKTKGVKMENLVESGPRVCES